MHASIRLLSVIAGTVLVPGSLVLTAPSDPIDVAGNGVACEAPAVSPDGGVSVAVQPSPEAGDVAAFGVPFPAGAVHDVTELAVTVDGEAVGATVAALVPDLDRLGDTVGVRRGSGPGARRRPRRRLHDHRRVLGGRRWIGGRGRADPLQRHQPSRPRDGGNREVHDRGQRRRRRARCRRRGDACAVRVPRAVRGGDVPRRLPDRHRFVRPPGRGDGGARRARRTRLRHGRRRSVRLVGDVSGDVSGERRERDRSDRRRRRGLRRLALRPLLHVSDVARQLRRCALPGRGVPNVRVLRRPHRAERRTPRHLHRQARPRSEVLACTRAVRLLRADRRRDRGRRRSRSRHDLPPTRSSPDRTGPARSAPPTPCGPNGCSR